jgi:hypothetical protein
MFGMAKNLRFFGLMSILIATPTFMASAAASGTYRSGHPPTLISALIDSQRRLVVTYSAPDGLTYGGKVYFDSNPLNAATTNPDPIYGSFMYCNNKSNCLGRWDLPTTPATGPFTFSTEPLDSIRFPDGKYYVQVETMNEDPFPSTRMWEESLVSVVSLVTLASSASFDVPLLTALKLPIDNGTIPCYLARERISLGNRLAVAINKNVEKLKSALAKVTNPSLKLKDDLAKFSAWIAIVSQMRASDQKKVISACSAAPALVAANGAFIPIPIPPTNGKAACTTTRSHLNYLNQELKKVVGNLTTTKKSQTVRIKQLEVRFNQLTADLEKSWPVAFQACNPL